MSKPKEYVIRNFDDILKIPTDSIADFLADFHEWILQRKILDEATRLAVEDARAAGLTDEEIFVNGKDVIEYGEVRWIDNGLAGAGMKAKLVNPEGKILQETLNLINTLRPRDNGEIDNGC